MTKDCSKKLITEERLKGTDEGGGEEDVIFDNGCNDKDFKDTQSIETM